jgi:hypothetical protein
MANVKVSALPTATSLDPADDLYIVQSGVSKQAPISELWGYTAVGNANYTILVTDVHVDLTATLATSSKTWTLPSAASYGAGRILRLTDSFGGITGTFNLNISRAGSDTINGLTTLGLVTPGAMLLLMSNGGTKWIIIQQEPPNYASPGNAAYTILPTDNHVVLTTALTAPRTWTMPTALAYGPSRILVIYDAAGGISATNTLTIQRQGTDGLEGGTSIVLNSAGINISFVSNGFGQWWIAGTFPLYAASITWETSTGNAIAGDIGEYIESIVSGVAVAASNTAKNATSISLTAGDWDVWGKITMAGTPTWQYFIGGSSLTTAANETEGQHYESLGAQTATGAEEREIPVRRISIASTTTVFLVINVVYTVAPSSIGGRISARRAR